MDHTVSQSLYTLSPIGAAVQSLSVKFVPDRNRRATSLGGTWAVRITLSTKSNELASSEYTNAAVKPWARQWMMLKRKNASVWGVSVIRVNYTRRPSIVLSARPREREQRRKELTAAFAWMRTFVFSLFSVSIFMMSMSNAKPDRKRQRRS